LTNVDVNNVIRIVERIAHGDANLHKVTVHLDLSSDVRPVKGDSVQLQQVILNLMLNAFSAMSGTGLDGARRLVVRTNSIDESNVLVEVQDSGTGIAAESSSRSSIPSSPASRKDWEWAFRSVAPSSNATAARYRLRTIPTAARTFSITLRRQLARAVASGVLQRTPC
jgi:hypothetical protein